MSGITSLRSRRRLIAVLVSGGLTVAACGSSKSSGSNTTVGSTNTTAAGTNTTAAGTNTTAAATTTTGAPPPADAKLTLMYITDATGNQGYTTLINTQFDGAVQAVNARGGIKGHPINVITCDSQSNNNGSAACGQKAVS
ncbi:MAG: Periplasmic binding protein, partial [Acidimicrobiaceae bacterium]|nr:Periplasmic binding protein [Acidimicrobiaceae bacterium]